MSSGSKFTPDDDDAMATAAAMTNSHVLPHPCPQRSPSPPLGRRSHDPQAPRHGSLRARARARARERKARSRANQTDEKREAERMQSRTGMATLRKKRAMLSGVRKDEGGRKMKAMPLARQNWPQEAIDLEEIMRVMHTDTDLCIYQIDKACDDDAEVYFIDVPTIAMARYGDATKKEVKKLGGTICQFRKTCDSMGDPKKKKEEEDASIIDKGICLKKGTVTHMITGNKMPRLLSIGLASDILSRSQKYIRSKTMEDNEVKLTPDELIVRRAVTTLTKHVEDSLPSLPPEVYDLVKSITLCAVGGKSLTLHESQVAMVVEKVFEFNKDLSKFQDCSEAVRTLAHRRVSDLFDKNPRKRSAASHQVNILQPRNKYRRRM
jgi:hypothetical protein